MGHNVVWLKKWGDNLNINDVLKIKTHEKPRSKWDNGIIEIEDVSYKNKKIWTNKIRVKVTFESDITSGLYYQFRWGAGPASDGKDKNDTSDEYVYFKKGHYGGLAIDFWLSYNYEISFESQWKGFEKWHTQRFYSDYNYNTNKPLRERYDIQGPTEKEDFEVKIKIKTRV